MALRPDHHQTETRDNDFGAVLIELRTARGWSQAKLADRANLDSSYVSRLESGTRAPAREAIARLADALVLPVVDRERLLAAAGFRSEAWDDPLLAQLVELLADPTLPTDVAADMRTLVRVAVQHGRRARDGRPFVRPDSISEVVQH